jgi:ribosomal protein S18 acetylase RimI-like enzyme
MDVEVRRVRPGDWRAYRTLRLEALRESPLAFVERYADAVAQPDAYWRDRIARAAAGTASSTIVADAAGTFVGTASCFVEPGGAHVVGVYVTPDWRGRDGVADRLLAAVVAWARDEVHADRIRLYVLADNGRARAFYRRVGFTESGATMAYPPDPTYTEVELVYRTADASGQQKRSLRGVPASRCGTPPGADTAAVPTQVPPNAR